MAKRASASKIEFWMAAIELFRESTLSCREFCDREGLSYSTFCRWQERLTNKANVNADSLLSSNELPKDPTSDESSDNGKSKSPGDDVKFVSAGVMVAGSEQKAGIEIQFSAGISITLCKKFDHAAFKDVISILGAELC